jgi:STAM-binding protein
MLKYFIWLFFWVNNSLKKTIDDGLAITNDYSNSEQERSSRDPILTQNDNTQMHRPEGPCSLISFETTESPAQSDIIRQPSPPPVLAEVQDLIPAVSQPSPNVLAEVQDLIPALSSQVSEAERGMENSLQDNLVHAESPLQLHIVRFYS